MEGIVQDLPAGLRGNYAAAGPDFTLPPPTYTEADHATWRRLYARQTALLPGHAAAAYRQALARLPFAGGVPDLEATSALLRAATGFSLVPVPGLIPDAPFFAHLAARRFPVTSWIRRPEEFDYIVEPDIFHDAFGHVPLLTEPAFADFLEAYGRMGEVATRLGALKPLARLYWHMVEFGLIREAGSDRRRDESPGAVNRPRQDHGGLRAYGAGILSSTTELLHSTMGAEPRRLRFDIARVLRSDYRIDTLQPTYFVIEDYAELFAAMRDLPALLTAARDAEPIPPGAAAPGDQPI